MIIAEPSSSEEPIGDSQQGERSDERLTFTAVMHHRCDNKNIFVHFYKNKERKDYFR